MEATSERRQNRRYDVATDVHGHVRLSHDLKILNISLTGIAAEAEKMLRVGNHYTIRVGGADGVTELDAVVRWCHLTRVGGNGAGEPRTAYHVGLDFRHVLEERAPELESLVEHAALVEVERRVSGRFRPRPGTTATVEMDHEFVLKRISFGGMLVETAGMPDPGCEVEFELPTDTGLFAARGKVAHVEPRNDRTIVGIGFEFPDAGSREILEHFIGGLLN